MSQKYIDYHLKNCKKNDLFYGKLPLSVFSYFEENMDFSFQRDLIDWLLFILQASQNCLDNGNFWNYSEKKPSFLKKAYSFNLAELKNDISYPSSYRDIDEDDIEENLSYMKKDKFYLDKHYNIKKEILYEYVYTKRIFYRFNGKGGKMPHSIYNYLLECKDKRIIFEFINWFIPCFESLEGCCENEFYWHYSDDDHKTLESFLESTHISQLKSLLCRDE